MIYFKRRIANTNDTQLNEKLALFIQIKQMRRKIKIRTKIKK
jgi:hypothetical protein